jgi:hypothetical protein
VRTIQDICALADRRLEEAQTLLDNRLFEGAFYLAGYAVELRLKARICKNLDIEDFYMKPVKVGKQAFFTHELDQLLTLSGLRRRWENETDIQAGNNIDLFNNCQVICQWSEETRYVITVKEEEARAFWKAINDPQNGFLPWLLRNW